MHRGSVAVRIIKHYPHSGWGDELHYVITAKSIALTGHDLSGTWTPWFLLWFRYPPQEHQAELPYILHLLVSAHFPFSLFYIKLPFALLSVGIVILLWAIASDLFGPLVGLTTAGLAAINPWLVVMGRTGYEATPTMFFYLLSFLVILKTKRWNVLWTLVPLVLAFYSYIATKVLFVPFIGIICIVAYIKNKKKYSNPYIILFIAALVITLGFS